jgi:hypothetical protein
MERGTGNDNIIKAAWYLYQCPGEDSGLFAGLDWEHAYGYSHVAASYIYLEATGGDTGKAWRGIEGNAAAQNTIMGIVSAIKGNPMPPSGFEVFLYNVGNQTSQSLMGWEYAPSGNLEIEKKSGNTAITNNNDCYSLAGAVFDVFDGGNTRIGTVTTDAAGKGRLDGIAAGTGYYIMEVSPPKGYAESKAKIPFEIASGQTTIKEIKNNPQGDPADILLIKLDDDAGEGEPQGGASLKGARFTITYYKGHYKTEDDLKGKTPARQWIVETDGDGFAMLDSISLVSGDPFYYDSTGKKITIPLGTITVRETKAPDGYLVNDELNIRLVTANTKVEGVTTYNAPKISDKVIRGGVSIEKRDDKLDRSGDPQGDATLAGAVLEIFNRNDKSVVVDGKTYSPGAALYTMTTNDAGVASTPNNFLPYGSYEIIEKTAPTGYLNTGTISRAFKIEKHNVIVSLRTGATAIKNTVITGGVEIEKYDIERDERALKQGDATLAGAVLEIWNRGVKSVVVSGKEYAPNTVVHTMTTDANGWAGTSGDLLPYGSYEIIEKTAPTGYLNTGIIKQSFKIRDNGVVISLKASDQVIKNNIIRGGVRVEKYDNEIDRNEKQGGASLEHAVFEIVNRGVDSVLVLGELYSPGEVVYVFETDEKGSALTANDLLPYSTYEVREISPPEGYLAVGVLSRAFEIRGHGKIVELDSSDIAIKNDPIRGDVKGVKISDGDANRLANVPFSITSKTTGESHIIVTDKNGEFNTSSAWNPHSQNTNRGETDRDGVWFGELWTLDDDNGALLYDNYILEELPRAANEGLELLTFEFSVYRHMRTIDFGTLTDDYTRIPEIFTTAMDMETGLNAAFVSETTALKDTVYYSNLKQNTSFVMRGILMDKETEQPLLDADGEEITAVVPFKTRTENGTVAMEFDVDSSALAGKSVVVFEYLETEDGKPVASHEDFDDDFQIIEWKDPSVKTEAASSAGNKIVEVAPETAITDVVSYTGLIPGLAFTASGVLMDKETGEQILIDGKPVTSERGFIADEASGTVKITFTLDTIAIQGKTLVVFEDILYKGRVICSHRSLESEEQSVTVAAPKIGTSAAGIGSEKEISVDKEVTIIDVLTYEELTPGIEHIAKGILMDKESGAPLMIGGQQVTAEKKFTPDKTGKGGVEIEFTLDTTAIQGKTLVVFEDVLYKGRVICSHRSLESEEQSVTVAAPKIGTSAAGIGNEKEILVGKEVAIIDVLTYEELAPGIEHIAKGILMDKESGAPLMIGGRQVTAEKIFIPDKTGKGSVEIKFIFDAGALAGKEAVVFEKVFISNVEIARHEELDSEAQTVKFYEIRLAVELTKTNSADNSLLDGAEFVLKDAAGAEVKLAKGNDGIYYPGESGSAMITTNGGKAVIDGLKKQIYTITETKAPDGFEGYFEPVALDVTEKNTVENPFLVTIMNAPEGGKSGTGAKTGGGGLPIWALFAGIAAAAAGAAIFIINRKKSIKVGTEG